MEVGLENSNFIKIDKDLNKGTTGESLYMWYSRAQGSYDVPIVDVNVTTSPSSEANHLNVRGVWDEVTCNLNLGAGGNFVYAWLRGLGGSEVFIWYRKTTDETDGLSDLNISVSDAQYAELERLDFEKVDINLNENTSGSAVYLWYKKMPGQSNIRGLVLLLNMEAVKPYQEAGITVIERNLNEGNGGAKIYMCHV